MELPFIVTRSVFYNSRYIDRNSLYPSCSITHEYPVGKPLRMVGKMLQNITMSKEKGFMLGEKKIVGAVQAKVLPRESLFLPVLPVVSNGKLKFGLCNKCMADMEKSLCRHTSGTRAITDTWTSIELEFAVTCGYKILKIYEFFTYENTKPIFRKFYTRLARMKLASEGFPENVVSDSEKKQHVDSLNQAMPGLNLKVEDVEKNPGKRASAKDMQNIGKFLLKSVNMQYIFFFFRIGQIQSERSEGQCSIRLFVRRIDEIETQHSSYEGEEHHAFNRLSCRSVDRVG